MHCAPHFSIDAEVTARFPEIKVGVAVIRDVHVAPQHLALEALKANVLSEVRQQLQDTPLAECPRVQDFWRQPHLTATQRRSSIASGARSQQEPLPGEYGSGYLQPLLATASPPYGCLRP